MSEKTTLYFVITKVIAPKNSFFNLILKVDNSKITLKSPRSRSNAYTIPYKIMKEVSILDSENPSYNIDIIFFDQDHPTVTGSVAIHPKEFLNVNSIELKQYDLNVPNIENVSVFVGVALIPIGKPFLPDFDIYGNSAKVITKNDSSENQCKQEVSPTNNPIEQEPEIVESESGKKHRRKKGTTDEECITFISQSGRSHKKHRIYSIPEHSPSFDQKVGDEEIIRSESGSPHRRKRGTKDSKTVTFISEGGHEHRRRRSHQHHQDQQNEEQNQQNEINNQDQQQEIENQNQQIQIPDQQNEIQNQPQQNEDQNQIQNQHHRRRRSHSQQQNQQPTETETAIAESESGRNRHRKKNSAIEIKPDSSVSEGVIRHRRKRNEEPQPEPQNEQQEPRRRRHRKPDSEEKNEEKQEKEINENQNNGSRRRRKEKSTTSGNETEDSISSKEKNSE